MINFKRVVWVILFIIILSIILYRIVRVSKIRKIISRLSTRKDVLIENEPDRVIISSNEEKVVN